MSGGRWPPAPSKNDLSAKKTAPADKPQICLRKSQPKPQSLLLSCRTSRLLQ